MLSPSNDLNHKLYGDWLSCECHVPAHISIAFSHRLVVPHREENTHLRYAFLFSDLVLNFLLNPKTTDWHIGLISCELQTMALGEIADPS